MRAAMLFNRTVAVSVFHHHLPFADVMTWVARDNCPEFEHWRPAPHSSPPEGETVEAVRDMLSRLEGLSAAVLDRAFFERAERLPSDVYYDSLFTVLHGSHDPTLVGCALGVVTECLLSDTPHYRYALGAALMFVLICARMLGLIECGVQPRLRDIVVALQRLEDATQGSSGWRLCMNNAGLFGPLSVELSEDHFRRVSPPSVHAAISPAVIRILHLFDLLNMGLPRSLRIAGDDPGITQGRGMRSLANAIGALFTRKSDVLMTQAVQIVGTEAAHISVFCFMATAAVKAMFLVLWREYEVAGRQGEIIMDSLSSVGAGMGISMVVETASGRFLVFWALASLAVSGKVHTVDKQIVSCFLDSLDSTVHTKPAKLTLEALLHRGDATYTGRLTTAYLVTKDAGNMLLSAWTAELLGVAFAASNELPLSEVYNRTAVAIWRAAKCHARVGFLRSLGVSECVE
jgi:hypothetical protein